MKTRKISFVALSSLLVLASCASAPMGPTVQVLPSPTKPFQVFQQDQADCKQYAQSEVAGQADSVNQKAVGTATIGAVLGGVLGAIVGNRHSAGVGGAAGVLAGTSIGSNSSAYEQRSIQAQYNNAYVQCMYSKGNQVSGARY